MVHLHASLFHIPHLARLMTVAGFVLTVATVVTVSQAPQNDAAYAQSTSQLASARQGYRTTDSQARSSKQTNAGSTAKGNNTAQSTTVKTTATHSPSPTPATKAAGATASVASKPGAAKPASPSPTPAPAAAPTAPAGTWKYALHSGIKTTYFWAGEEASADNDFIQNISSAWQDDWKSHFGGTDNPSSRCGYSPCGFTPSENPFYFALPFSDFTDSGPISNPNIIPWYNAAGQAQLNAGQSILKNRWIQITALGKTVYAQWEDVGPFNEHDSNYVFGTSAPASTRAGLDVSPAVRDYLGMGSSTTSSWRFVDYNEVPAGPWKNTITTSGTDWH